MLLLKAIGWIIWLIVAFLAVSWAYGMRTYAKAGQPFQRATAVQTFFLSVISLVFLLTDYSKLHILWVGPVCFLGAIFLALSGIPILSPLVMLATRVFVEIVLVGVQRPRN